MTPSDLNRIQSYAVSVPECVVCNDRGCEFCGAVVEPWPAEAFTLFGVTDLQQLSRDIDEELERRAGL